MTDHPGFLAAILEHPEDDTPRLVYADWLEENGRPERAEFIRVQIEALRLEAFVDEWSNTPGRAEDGAAAGEALAKAQHLRRRERELLKGRWLDWSGFPLTFHSLQTMTYTFRRGFVEAVTCAAADWLAHGRAVLQAQPVVRVTFADGALVLSERDGRPVEEFLTYTLGQAYATCGLNGTLPPPVSLPVNQPQEALR